MNSIVISVVELPGNGLRDVTVPQGTTLAELVSQEGLGGRSICIDGVTVTGNFGDVVLTSGVEVAALTPSKGN